MGGQSCGSSLRLNTPRDAEQQPDPTIISGQRSILRNPIVSNSTVVCSMRDDQDAIGLLWLGNYQFDRTMIRKDASVPHILLSPC
jgi:hypothetical protein